MPEDDHGVTLLHVNDEVRAELIDALDDDVLLAATEGMPIDDLADLIEDLPEQVTREVLHTMGLDKRRGGSRGL